MGPPILRPHDLAYLTRMGMVLVPLTAVLVEPIPGDGWRILVHADESLVLPVGVRFAIEIIAPCTHPAQDLLPGVWVDDVPPHVGRVFWWPSYVYTTTYIYAGGPADIDLDGDSGTDADIEAFFRCLATPNCGSADFDGDGASATDADIECFFRVLGGGGCET